MYQSHIYHIIDIKYRNLIPRPHPTQPAMLDPNKKIAYGVMTTAALVSVAMIAGHTGQAMIGRDEPALSRFVSARREAAKNRIVVPFTSDDDLNRHRQAPNERYAGVLSDIGGSGPLRTRGWVPVSRRAASDASNPPGRSGYRGSARGRSAQPPPVPQRRGSVLQGSSGASNPGTYGSSNPGTSGANNPGTYGASNPGWDGISTDVPKRQGSVIQGSSGASNPGTSGHSHKTRRRKAKVPKPQTELEYTLLNLVRDEQSRNEIRDKSSRGTSLESSPDNKRTPPAVPVRGNSKLSTNDPGRMSNIPVLVPKESGSTNVKPRHRPSVSSRGNSKPSTDDPEEPDYSRRPISIVNPIRRSKKIERPLLKDTLNMEFAKSVIESEGITMV